MSTNLIRITDKNNNIQYPPAASHQLVIDGKQVQTYIIDEVEQLALAEILRLRDIPKPEPTVDIPKLQPVQKKEDDQEEQITSEENN
jgi:exosome complex RNA-binding protein Csl4